LNLERCTIQFQGKCSKNIAQKAAKTGSPDKNHHHHHYIKKELKVTPTMNLGLVQNSHNQKSKTTIAINPNNCMATSIAYTCYVTEFC